MSTGPLHVADLRRTLPFNSMRYSFAAFAVLLSAQLVSAQDLPVPRRLLILTQRFLDSGWSEMRQLPFRVIRVAFSFFFGSPNEDRFLTHVRLVGLSEPRRLLSLQ